MEGEQSPNPASRVTLSDEIDALGMRRAVLDWQIDPLDGSNLYQTAMELARSVGAAGLGRMVVNLEPGDELSKVSTLAGITWVRRACTMIPGKASSIDIVPCTGYRISISPAARCSPPAAEQTRRSRSWRSPFV